MAKLFFNEALTKQKFMGLGLILLVILLRRPRKLA